MHEMSLLSDVVDIVINACRDPDIKRVTKVRLAVGALRDVIDEFVPDVFARPTAGTIAQGARVELIRVPATARCGTCGHSVDIDLVDYKKPVCRQCGADRGFNIATGNEFMVLDIEVEAPSSQTQTAV